MWFSSRQKINLKSQNKPRAQDAKHKNKHEWSHEQLKRLGMTQVFGLPFFGSGAVADDGASSPLLSSSLHSSLVLFLINPSFPFFLVSWGSLALMIHGVTHHLGRQLHPPPPHLLLHSQSCWNHRCQSLSLKRKSALSLMVLSQVGSCWECMATLEFHQIFPD